MCIYKYIHPNKTFLAEASHSVSFQRKMLKHFLQKKKKILQTVHNHDCLFHLKIQCIVAPKVQK